MSSKSSTRLFWTVILDQPRKIRFSNAAIYQLQSQPGGFDFADLSNKRKQVASIIQLVWAMLCDGDELPRPQDVAEVMPLSDGARMGEISRAVSEAVEYAQKKDETKNASPGPSPTPGSTAD
jgi:hypothetical protein